MMTEFTFVAKLSL